MSYLWRRDVVVEMRRHGWKFVGEMENKMGSQLFSGSIIRYMSPEPLFYQPKEQIMKNINTYLIFNGNCRQAMKFYEQCLGGELYMMPYCEMPGGCADLPKEAKDWIMHARLTKGSMVLMASDTRPGIPIVQGNNFFVSVNCESVQEAEKLFKALGEKGAVTMPLEETFWALRFGMLTDQFGIKWMLNLDNKPSGNL